MSLLRALNKIATSPIRKFRRAQKERHIFGLSNPEERFTAIYTLNYWRNKESVSGGGSSLAYTASLRQHLPELFKKFEITSIFDAPCGDFNWMPQVLNAYPLRYIGGDIVKPLVEKNQAQYASESITFLHVDLTKDAFPSADLMFCRDCLFHLSYADIRAVLQNFVNSQIKYILLTTHKNADKSFANADITTGSFRKIDLFAAPFHFPTDALFRIPDWLAPDPEREMCLWSREQIISALENTVASPLY